MITAADADASLEICARRRAFLSPDEVVNGVEADQSHDDQIDLMKLSSRGTIRIKMPARRGDERRDVGNGEGHWLAAVAISAPRPSYVLRRTATRC
jgi:hypothetical protein